MKSTLSTLLLLSVIVTGCSTTAPPGQVAATQGAARAPIGQPEVSPPLRSYELLRCNWLCQLATQATVATGVAVGTAAGAVLGGVGAPVGAVVGGVIGQGVADAVAGASSTNSVPGTSSGSAPAPNPQAVPATGAHYLDLKGYRADAVRAPNPSNLMIDGDTTTNWNYGGGVDEDAYVVIDLEKPTAVLGLDLMPHANPPGTVSWTVLVSNDRANWRPVKSGSGTSETFSRMTWPVETVRYVRIKADKWNDSWVSIWEAKLIAP
ncbi:MAG: Coagulation factor 5/8 type protein [Cyanobacteria bacterium RYN_339]|nr:Coagulation factor 5/8 type protein [Cyanobacteria bacterium RYN_339]